MDYSTAVFLAGVCLGLILSLAIDAVNSID